MRRMHVCGFQLNPRLSSTLKPFTHIHARINPLTIIPTHTHTKNSSVINQPPNTTTTNTNRQGDATKLRIGGTAGLGGWLEVAKWPCWRRKVIERPC